MEQLVDLGYYITYCSLKGRFLNRVFCLKDRRFPHLKTSNHFLIDRLIDTK